jgi:DNA-binding transcriptional ArsR family regulator
MFNQMVEHTEAHLDAIFRALADATRRQMLAELAAGERTVGQLAEPFTMSLAAASKHVRVLEEAGLIRREVQGRSHLCRLDPAVLSRAAAFLAGYEPLWIARLLALETGRR